MSIDKDYQKAIKTIRKEREKRLTQKEVAEKMETTQKTISNIENFSQEVNIKTIIKLCRILNINPKEILFIFLNEE